MNSVISGQAQRGIQSPTCPISFNWADNPDIQRLLDVIAEIIASEYIEIAKKNKSVHENESIHLRQI